MQSLAFFVAMVLVLSTYSRLPEIASILAGGTVPLAVVTSIFAVVAIGLCSEAFMSTLQSRFSLWLIGYTCWLLLTIPVSTWRGGSLTVFSQEWVRSLFVFYAVGSLIFVFEDVRRMMHVMVWAIDVIAVFSLQLGTTYDGRFSFNIGTLANANDYAIHILLVLPICAFVATDRRSPRFQRILAGVTAAWILYSNLQTGSRTGLLMLGTMTALGLIATSLANRVKILVAVIVCVIPALLLMPPTLRARYFTMFSNESTATNLLEQETVESAQSSADLRHRLFVYSVRLTLTHPIFGVGMGNFAGVATETSSQNADRVFWRQAHNIYGQIAAETGFPGLLLYIAIVICCLRACIRLRRLTRNQPALVGIHDVSGALLATQLCYTVASFFATSTYGFYLPLMAAFTCALERCARQEIALARKPLPAG